MKNFIQYDSREAAGFELTDAIAELKLSKPRLLAIPRGGVQVAEAIADKIKQPILPLIVKKLPAPGSPEYGFGAIAEDGTKILNENAVKTLGLTNKKIEEIAQFVIEEIKHRKAAYGGFNPETLQESDVIIVDDGVATGYSLLAGINSVKKFNPKSIKVAVPVCSYSAYYKIKELVDNVVCPIVSDEEFFAVANYYKIWYDLSETEIITILEKYRVKYSG